jgi:hypothetical protein
MWKTADFYDDDDDYDDLKVTTMSMTMPPKPFK